MKRLVLKIKSSLLLNNILLFIYTKTLNQEVHTEGVWKCTELNTNLLYQSVGRIKFSINCPSWVS